MYENALKCCLKEKFTNITCKSNFYKTALMQSTLNGDNNLKSRSSGDSNPEPSD